MTIQKCNTPASCSPDLSILIGSEWKPRERIPRLVAIRVEEVLPGVPVRARVSRQRPSGYWEPSWRYISLARLARCYSPPVGLQGWVHEIVSSGALARLNRAPTRYDWILADDPLAW